MDEALQKLEQLARRQKELAEQMKKEQKNTPQPSTSGLPWSMPSDLRPTSATAQPFGDTDTTVAATVLFLLKLAEQDTSLKNWALALPPLIAAPEDFRILKGVIDRLDIPRRHWHRIAVGHVEPIETFVIGDRLVPSLTPARLGAIVDLGVGGR
mgnify:CR=1 FL=1